MAAPTQVFPPWLTPVPVTTEANGAEVVQTSISFIPLGYFGPSIPLDSDFTFGGSTFPPTIVVGPPTTTPSPTSSSTSTISTTSTPSSASTSMTSSTSTPTVSASSSSAVPSQSSAASGNSHGLSLGTKLAIGLSIALVAILLFVLLLVFLRVRRRRSARSLDRHSDNDWQIVEASDLAAGAGEETLLPEEHVMRHRAATHVIQTWMRANYQPVDSTSADPAPRTSHNSGGSAAEGIASSSTSPQSEVSRSTIAPSALFFNSARSHEDTPREMEEHARQSSSLGVEVSPTYARLPPGASPPLMPPRSHGRTLSMLSDEDPYIPAGIVGASRSRSRHHSTESLPYPESPPSEVDESATLLTAQRVDLGPQVPVSTMGSQRNSPDNNREGRTLAGLTGLAALQRFSWFRRIQNQSPTAFRHSSPPVNPTGEVHRSSSFNRLSFHPASRPHSALLYPGQDSRPTSDFNYFGLADNELGLRPPTALLSVGQSSGSRNGSGNGSGSARSGQTIYHSATSRSHSLGRSTSEFPRGSRLVDVQDIDTMPAPAETTIRTVDVLDTPAPEPTLPLQAALSPDNLLSRTPSPGGSPTFPPGLVAVPRWDAPASPFPGISQLDILDQAPPRSPDEWSSLKSRRSPDSGGTPVERLVDTERNVEVASGSLRPMSEEGIVEPGQSVFLGSPVTAGFSLTPRVSLYAPSEGRSQNTGSHSSRPSERTTFSHDETHESHNEPFSDDDYHPPPGQRASLSAIGGHRLRHKPSAVAERVLPAPEEHVSEEERSRAGSRPGSVVSGGSRQTASETVVSRSTSNPAGQAFDSIGKAGGQEAASIIDVLQSSRQQSP